MKKEIEFCGFCRTLLPNHQSTCPTFKIQNRELKKSQTLSTMVIVEGYRLKHKLSGKFYSPNGKSALGHLYSKRGIVSLLSYNYSFFNATQTHWKVLEYDVGDEIDLIDTIPLNEWVVFQNIVRRRNK